MNIGRETALIAALSLGQVTGAVAQDNNIEFSANVALVTDYIYRGITQTDNGLAIQGGFDAAYGVFYAGTWASSVDFRDDTTMEIDFYGGVAPNIGETNFDFGVIYYAYPDSPELPTGTQNFVEFYAGIGQSFGPIEPSVKVSYSPDFYGETGGAFYIEGDVALQIIEELSASAGIGASLFEDDLLNDDYIDFNAGITAASWGLDFDLRFHSTSNRVGGSDDDVVVFALSRSF